MELQFFQRSEQLRTFFALPLVRSGLFVAIVSGILTFIPSCFEIIYRLIIVYPVLQFRKVNQCVSYFGSILKTICHICE